METRDIDGQPATDRRGAAEYLHRSLQTIKLLASKRADNGFPAPVDVETTGRGIRPRGDDGTAQGREWYALADLDTFRATYIDRVEAAGQARVHGDIHLTGDPEELLTGHQVAAILQISPDTLTSWVRDSQPDWDASEPGYLPPPDETKPRGRGLTRWWKRATIQQFLHDRHGTIPTGGRPPGPTATVADLIAVLDATPDLTNRDIAAALTRRLGFPVRMPTVIRLQRQRRTPSTS